MGDASKLILLVEDDVDARDAIRDILEFDDYQTVLAANGQEALAILNSASIHPDLLLSDIYCKPINSLDLAQRLAEQPEWHTLPVIFLSGEAELEIELHGSIRAVITKPFRRRELLEAIAQALA